MIYTHCCLRMFIILKNSKAFVKVKALRLHENDES